MGGAIKKFAVYVGKQALKGIVRGTIGAVPLIGGPVATWVNSKYAVGSGDLGNLGGVKVPQGTETKLIGTPAQLQQLVKEYPAEASKAGLTVDMIKEGVVEAKSEPVKASMAVGGKVKKPRSKAQLAATKKLVEANRLRRLKK